MARQCASTNGPRSPEKEVPMTTVSLPTNELLSKVPLIGVSDVYSVYHCSYSHKPTADVVFNYRRFVSVTMIEQFLDLDGHLISILPRSIHGRGFRNLSGVDLDLCPVPGFDLDVT